MTENTKTDSGLLRGVLIALVVFAVYNFGHWRGSVETRRERSFFSRMFGGSNNPKPCDCEEVPEDRRRRFQDLLKEENLEQPALESIEFPQPEPKSDE